MTDTESIARGKRVFEIEAQAVADLGKKLGAEFSEAVDLCMKITGKVVVTGMGKSGLIGQKIAATMASTGTPAFFLHPAEGLHGDLGIVGRDDLVVALSNSGETSELLSILPSLKRLGVPIIAITGKNDSTLGRVADVVLNVGVAQEACPLNLAPTASTTAALAMGDALAVALLEAKGFGEEDFALSHPGGSLGRRLLMRVSDGMHTGADIPRVSPDTPMRDAIMEITKKRLGITTVVDADGQLLGVLSDGDLRRQLESGTSFLDKTAGEVMSAGGKRIAHDALAAEAVTLMERHQITSLVVVDDGRMVGIVHLHDLLKLGLG
ncbi:MAG: KpsF/GutQ family sugar-phosphate isomerase [Nitrospirota bacterium]|nr:KpsF/GutQ family sugar-phosphate isomerase [Nitrospirota bacterium]